MKITYPYIEGMSGSDTYMIVTDTRKRIAAVSSENAALWLIVGQKYNMWDANGFGTFTGGAVGMSLPADPIEAAKLLEDIATTIRELEKHITHENQ